MDAATAVIIPQPLYAVLPVGETANTGHHGLAGFERHSVYGVGIGKVFRDCRMNRVRGCCRQNGRSNDGFKRTLFALVSKG